MKPRLLDLFCGAGGAAKGYQRAGFYVVGIDNCPQPHYCGDEFIQADALEYAAAHGREFDAIHASPPCQRYSSLNSLTTGETVDLIEPTRCVLIATGKPYVIENVPGAPLVHPTMLCGMMFNLDLYRHRFFETTFHVPFMLDYGHGRKQDPMRKEKPRQGDIVCVAGHAQYKGYLERARKAMDIPWMNADEISQAIPPAYTEYIGRYLREAL